MEVLEVGGNNLDWLPKGVGPLDDTGALDVKLKGVGVFADIGGKAAAGAGTLA